jgi:hypothetical protein
MRKNYKIELFKQTIIIAKSKQQLIKINGPSKFNFKELNNLFTKNTTTYSNAYLKALFLSPVEKNNKNSTFAGISRSTNIEESDYLPLDGAKILSDTLTLKLGESFVELTDTIKVFKKINQYEDSLIFKIVTNEKNIKLKNLKPGYYLWKFKATIKNNNGNLIKNINYENNFTIVDEEEKNIVLNELKSLKENIEFLDKKDADDILNYFIQTSAYYQLDKF